MRWGASFGASLFVLTACGGAAPAPRTAADEDEEALPHVVALRLEDAGVEGATDTPRTRVLLVHIPPDGERSVTELSTEPGACYQRQPPEGVLIAAHCWWAGSGAAFEVRREGDAVVAYRAGVEEETGTAAPREVGRFELPEGAHVQVLVPDGTLPSMR